MCGIVGAIADRDVVNCDGLKRLEYGVTTRRASRWWAAATCAGCGAPAVAEMEAAALAEGVQASLGIGHTRWATHGGVTEANAHPHISHGVALVHNGIIENHEAQRERLSALGYQFESQTDTEVIAHLIHHHMQQGRDLLAALQAAVQELEGAFALAVVHQDEPDRLVCARMGCPLLVGWAKAELRRLRCLGDRAGHAPGDLPGRGRYRRGPREKVRVFDPTVRRRARSTCRTCRWPRWSKPLPHIRRRSTSSRARWATRSRPSWTRAHSSGCSGGAVTRGRGRADLACGTSFTPARWRYWIEASRAAVQRGDRQRIPLPQAVANPLYLVVTISQSGETLDTMEALKYAKSLATTDPVDLQRAQSASARQPAGVLHRAGRSGSLPLRPSPPSWSGCSPWR